MISHAYDLRYDANGVGADLVVETWISHGPRANDAVFDPRVVRRDGNRVWVQLDLSHLFVGVSSATAKE